MVGDHLLPSGHGTRRTAALAVPPFHAPPRALVNSSNGEPGSRHYDEAGDYREKDPLLGDPDHLLALQHDYGAAFRGIAVGIGSPAIPGS